jgi:hypothetical protein
MRMTINIQEAQMITMVFILTDILCRFLDSRTWMASQQDTIAGKKEQLLTPLLLKAISKQRLGLFLQCPRSKEWRFLLWDLNLDCHCGASERQSSVSTRLLRIITTKCEMADPQGIQWSLIPRSSNGLFPWVNNGTVISFTIAVLIPETHI